MTSDQDFLRSYAASANTGQRSQLADALGPTLAREFGLGPSDTLPDVPTFPPSSDPGPAQPGLTDSTTVVEQQPTPTPAPAKLTPEQREQLRQQQRQQAQVRASASRLGVGGLRQFGMQVRELNAAAARVPTPGGVGGMALALLVIVSMIVPVNAGHTRFELLWLTLTGRTKLPEPVTAGDGGSSSNGGEVLPPSANPPSNSAPNASSGAGTQATPLSAAPPTPVAPRIAANSVKLPGML